jgi:glycosyltransferase involved in cell wall biosynthesis
MHVYLFSPIPYSFLHQRPQKLADQFVALGIPVTFIEPCGLSEYLSGRKKGLPLLVVRSLWYLLLGLLAFLIPGIRRKPRPSAMDGKPESGLRIVDMPFIIPNNRVDSALLERINASVYRQTLIHRVFRRMHEGEESIAIVENPLWGLVLEKGDFSKITYDCIDDITLFSGRGSAERIVEYERRLLGMSEAVYVTAEKLEENLRAKTKSIPILRVPNGVDYDFFQSRTAGGEAPADLATVQRPIVGYVGVLRDWMDYDLLEFIAGRMPGISFVLVGPIDFEFRIEHLRKMRNVVFPGRKDYRDIPAFVNGFDVCMIPFLTGPVSHTTNPVKIFEYFALGKPVVSSPLHELEQFREKGLLWIANGKEEFAAAVAKAMKEGDGPVRKRRREVARQHSWKTLAGSMLAAVSKDEPLRHRGTEKRV